MAADGSDRRSILVAGLGIFGAVLILVLVAVVADGGAGDPVATTAPPTTCPADRAPCSEAAAGERPGIIPRPGEGQRPTEPGQRGGWEQVALLGVVVVAVALIATVVVRSARRARRVEIDDGTPAGTSP